MNNFNRFPYIPGPSIGANLSAQQKKQQQQQQTGRANWVAWSKQSDRLTHKNNIADTSGMTNEPPTTQPGQTESTEATRWKSSFAPLGPSSGSSQQTASQDKSRSRSEKAEIYDPFDRYSSESEHEDQEGPPPKRHGYERSTPGHGRHDDHQWTPSYSYTDDGRGPSPDRRPPEHRGRGLSPDRRPPEHRGRGPSPDRRAPEHRGRGPSPDRRPPEHMGRGQSPDRRPPEHMGRVPTPDRRPPEHRGRGPSPDRRPPEHRGRGPSPDKRPPEHRGRGPSPDRRPPEHRGRGPSPDKRPPEHRGRGPSPDRRPPEHRGRGISPDRRPPEHRGRGPSSPRDGPSFGRSYSPDAGPHLRAGYAQVTPGGDRREYSPDTLPEWQAHRTERQFQRQSFSPEEKLHDMLGSMPASGIDKLFPIETYRGQSTNGKERTMVPEARKESTNVRSSPPQVQMDQPRFVVTGVDQLRHSTERTRSRSRSPIREMESPFTCELCEVQLASMQDLEKHLESKSHWDTLEYIQQQKNYDDLAIAFLQEVMLYKVRHFCNQAVEEPAIEELCEKDHMTKVEMLHCAACKVYVSKSTVLKHLSSQEHLHNKKGFGLKQRFECLSKAETMMKELKPQYEHFLKGADPFE